MEESSAARQWTNTMEEETAEPPREKQGGDTEEAEKKGKGKEMKEMMKAKKTEQRKNQDEDQYS